MSQSAVQPQSSAAAVTVSNGVMVGAVIFLFLVVVVVFFLYLYARRRLQAHPRLRTFRFVPEQQQPNSRLGLDPAVLGALPVTLFQSEESLECAVCLSEVSHGERVRMLPKCGHGFHIECIDMWFHSHSTCPLCRSPVVVVVPSETPPQEVPTNVLFWGNSDRVSQRAAPDYPSGRGMLVIEIPSRRFPAATEEEQRSPASARLRSLVRLLSFGRRETIDVEQGGAAVLGGEGSSLPPKSLKPSNNY